jgi:hypothetical protein
MIGYLMNKKIFKQGKCYIKLAYSSIHPTFNIAKLNVMCVRICF